MLASLEPVRTLARQLSVDELCKVLHGPANAVTDVLDEQPRPDLDSEAVDFRALPTT